MNSIAPHQKSGSKVVGENAKSLSQDEIEIILNKQFLTIMIDSLPGVFYLLDENKRVLRWNRTYQDGLGYSKDELYGMDALQTIAEEDRIVALCAIDQILEQGSASLEAQILTKTGEKTPYYLAGTRIIVDHSQFVLGMGVNIRKLKDAEKEIRRHNEELEVIVSVSKAMRITKNLTEFHRVVLDQISELFKVNGAALAQFDPLKNQDEVVLGDGGWENWTRKYLPPEIKGLGIHDLSRLDLQNLNTRDNSEFISPKMFGNLTTVMTVPLVTLGETLGALWVGRNVPFSQAEIKLLTAIADMVANAIHRQNLFEDIQKQLIMINNTRSQLLQSEKLAAIGELVAGVAHELNNPLTSIILYARMIQQNYKDEILGKDIEIILQESQRAAKIVRGLLDFSRQRLAEKKPTQINDVLNASLAMLSYELVAHQISWSLKLKQDLPVIMADPIQLQQVFIILINNAWQAISQEKKNGHLSISTQVMPSDFLTDGTSPDMIHLIFQDDGPGIAADNLNHIFDPFFTTKAEGTGLGLSVCHGIVTEHGGHIWAENNSEGGAIFHLELPAIFPTESDGTARNPGEIPGSETILKRKILVVDDEASILEIVSRLLKRQGFEVDTANDGNSAMSLLQNNPYDLILCDIRMPGLSGPEFYNQVQQKNPGLANRIIFSTGDTTNPTTRQFFEKTGALFLSKPFDLEQLMAKIHFVLSPIQE